LTILLLPFSFVPLYTTCSLKDESLWKLQNNNAKGEKIKNVGLINIIGDGVERSGRGSSQMQGIRSLQTLSEQSVSLIRKEDSQHRMISDLA
jgi:hypothetical protein